MSRESDDELERELVGLTRWDGGDVQAWRAALEARGATGATRWKGFGSRFWTKARWSWGLAGIAAAAWVLLALPVLHSLGSSVASRAGNWRWSHGSERFSLHSLLGADVGRFGTPSTGDAEDAARNAGPAEGGYYSNDNTESFPSHYFVHNASQKTKTQVEAASPSPDRKAPDADRHVIRKATIELRTSDVRAAFLKASHLVSEAHGEYVQESSLTGGDQRLEGNLTLRVEADRLSTVLQAIRELGTVRAETAGGEDVTTQVVDLEARLNNEKRVEAELLQLMEKRTDAPLKEVLELRAAIANVRQSIETMTAQRERLSRLVSLATVLVIIRPADAPEPVTPGLWDYFTTAITRAAQRGLEALINTVAGLILVLIGGAVWIILAAIGAVILIRRLRAAARTE
jgi:hypothetical protein